LATMISILGTIVALLLSVILSKDTTPSLALFITHFNPKNGVHLFAAAANIFSFWLLGVMAVGLSQLADVRFSKALFAVAIYWLVFITFLISIGILAAHLVPGAK
jgi:hypothetical protein